MIPKTNPEDAKDWIKRVINSCENDFHFHCAENLIDCFKAKYPNETIKRGELLDKLNDQIQTHFPPSKLPT